ncbi:unnamed protein product [Rotaria sp. Silwood2]|nr:unnamed protein product [Rotaria sp. Silwood2]
MTNRHQSKFIGQDLLSCLHFEVEESCSNTDMKYWGHLNEVDILAYQRRMSLGNDDEKLVDQYLNDEDDGEIWVPCTTNSVLGYHEHLFKQTEQKSDTSLFRMLSAKDHFIKKQYTCPMDQCNIAEVRDLIHVYNHLIFDFDTHQLVVERLPDETL